MEKQKLNKIAEVLNKKAINQRQIANNFNLNKNTVSRWCANLQQPALCVYFDLADFLGVHVFDLINAPKKFVANPVIEIKS